MRILINGRACSGKDEVGDYLAKKYGFQKISFATPIYSIARNLFNMKQKDRTLLIDIGNKMREIDPDIFVKWALRQLKSDRNYVISDCRQLNEYKLSTQEEFLPIRVKSDLNTRIQRAIHRDGSYPNTEEWEGASETGADNCEYLYEIENNFDLENLHKQIDKLLELNNFKTEEKIPIPCKVKITKINNKDKEEKLAKYIDQEGYIMFSPIIKDDIKRYKVYFLDEKEEVIDKEMFRLGEFQVIKDL